MTENGLESKSAEEIEIDREIKLAEKDLEHYPGKDLDKVIIATLHRFDNDPERAADSLVAQKIFKKTADCPDPMKVALAAVTLVAAGKKWD